MMSIDLAELNGMRPEYCRQVRNSLSGGHGRKRRTDDLQRQRAQVKPSKVRISLKASFWLT